jgi:hypothetical protein
MNAELRIKNGEITEAHKGLNKLILHSQKPVIVNSLTKILGLIP